MTDTINCAICEKKIARLPHWSDVLESYVNKDNIPYDSLSDFYEEVTGLYNEAGEGTFVCESCVEYAHEMIMKRKCKHPTTRWLWSEPKECQEAFEQWVTDNRYPLSDIESTEKREEFYEKNNIRICCTCGQEVK